jgi:hypothetical protein
LVEFALVLPLLLFLVVGVMGLGLVMLNRMQLQHAASETAVEAATSDCAAALGRVHQILGYHPHLEECKRTGQLVTVTLAHTWPTLLPVLPETIIVRASAFVRDPQPTPEASPS